MEKNEQVAALEPLQSMLVVAEVANRLRVKPGRVHALIEEGALLSRFATLEECGQLLASGRIKGVPSSGIRLVPIYAAEQAVDRRKPGWPKGKTRKQRF